MAIQTLFDGIEWEYTRSLADHQQAATPPWFAQGPETLFKKYVWYFSSIFRHYGGVVLNFPVS
jgi:hypothetical protein